MSRPDKIRYRGATYIRADAAQDAEDRDRARKVVQMVRQAVTSAKHADKLGWERGDRSGLVYWTTDITDLLGVEVPVELRIVDDGYMEKFVDFLGGAGAALDRTDPTKMVLVVNLVDRDGNLQWNEKVDCKYLLHELIHAIDYSREWEEMKDKESAPIGSRSYHEDEHELRAYFGMGVEEMIHVIKKAHEKNGNLLENPSTVGFFWKWSVGFTDWDSFEHWALQHLEPKWYHNLGPEGKRWVERKLMELWEHLNKEFTIEGPD